jgi:hypothetical protein
LQQKSFPRKLERIVQENGQSEMELEAYVNGDARERDRDI